MPAAGPAAARPDERRGVRRCLFGLSPDSSAATASHALAHHGRRRKASFFRHRHARGRERLLRCVCVVVSCCFD